MKLPKWDENEIKFQIFWTRFQVYARVNIFAVGLETQVNIPTLDAYYDVLFIMDDP